MKLTFLFLLFLMPLFSYSQYEIILNSGDTVQISSYKEDNGFYAIKKQDGSSARLSIDFVKSIKRVYSGTATGQRFVYCELVGTQKFFSSDVVVAVDYGLINSYYGDNIIIDKETGKAQTFNSMVDALNYMGSMGWEFVQAYTATTGQSNVYRWLLKKAEQ